MTDIVSNMIAAISGRRVRGEPGSRVGVSTGRAVGLAGSADRRRRDAFQPMGPTAFMRDAQPLTTEQLREPSVQREPDRYADMARRNRLAGRQPQTNIELSPRDTLPADFPLGPTGVISAPRLAPSTEAAEVTGVPRSFLDTLIGHESAGNPTARPRRRDGTLQSSALGHGQFIEGTWKRMMNTYGPRYGFGSGSLTGLSQQEVLELRTDPRWSALMTAHYAAENAAALRASLNRPVTDGEVYLAHFLGPGDAVALIREANGRNRAASHVVSRNSVTSNETIFFDPNGRARTAREVRDLQTRRFNSTIFKTEGRG